MASYELIAYGIQSPDSNTGVTVSGQYYTSADGSVKSSFPVFAVSNTYDLEVKWNDAGAKGVIGTQLGQAGTIALTPAVQSKTINLFLAPAQGSRGTVSASIQLFSSDMKPFLLTAPNVVSSDVSWSVTVTNGNTIYVTCPATSVFYITLFSKTLQMVSGVQVGAAQSTSGGYLLLQAIELTQEERGVLKYPTLQPRGQLSRDRHAVTDTGEFLYHASSTNSPKVFVMTAFGSRNENPAESNIDASDQWYYSSSDLTVSSETLSSNVVPGDYKVSYGPSDPSWSNAGNLGARELNIVRTNMTAALVTVFFTRDPNSIDSRSTTFSMYSKSAPLLLQLPNNTSSYKYKDWVVYASSDKSSVTITGPENFTDLPYIQFAYNGSGEELPTITKLESTSFPIQFFSASDTPVVSAENTSGPCFDYAYVKSKQKVLFKDGYGNDVYFNDLAVFNIANVNMKNALSVPVPVAVNTSQGSPVGPFATEVKKNGTWVWAQKATEATKYSFVEYVPKANEYGGKKSIILLLADGKGYVTVSTPSPNFAPTVTVTTLQDVVSKQVQWGVLFQEIPFSPLGRSSAVFPLRSVGLIYADKNLKGPLSIAVGSNVSLAPTDAKEPTAVPFSLAGQWAAHGVWKTSTQPLQYNPRTLRVQTVDHDNVIPGTGFTESNTNIQWQIFPAPLSQAQAEATVGQQLKTITDTKNIAAKASSIASAMYAGNAKNVSDVIRQAVSAEVAASTAEQSATNEIATMAKRAAEKAFEALQPHTSKLAEVDVNLKGYNVCVNYDYVGYNSRVVVYVTVAIWIVLVVVLIALLIASAVGDQ